MIIRSPPNQQRNVSHHGKENCRCIEVRGCKNLPNRVYHSGW